jgi:antiviral helicase SKI2
MTAEILKNSLLRQNSENTVYEWNFNPEKVAYVILDEVHFINNPERGKVWEEILLNLSPKIRLVMLSATISGAVEMVEWLGNLKKVKCHLVSTLKRPVPLKHTIYWNDNLHTFLENDTQWKQNVWTETKKEMDKYYSKNRFTIAVFHKCLDYLKNNNLLPATVFLLNREMVEKQAKTLHNFISDHLESAEINNIWNKYLKKYESIYQYTEQWSMVYDLVNKGVGIHHSGMIPILKEIVEILYSKGAKDKSSIRVIVSRSEKDLQLIKDRYYNLYYEKLTDVVGEKMTGQLKNILKKILGN